MKKALILVNAYTQNLHELNQPARLKEELLKLHVHADIVRNCSVALLGDGAKEYDFCIYLDKDKMYSHMLERRGLRLFNRADAIEVCDDKMLTYLALSEKVPQPETLPAPLCYTPSVAVPREFLAEAAEKLGLPLVVKENHGSLGTGVHLARTYGELVVIAESIKEKAFCLQRFVEESAGQDLRVIVVGGKPVAAMKRTNAIDFRSNIELGGRGEAYTLNAAEAALSSRVAETLGLDYCGIDFLFGQEGLLVCEVNSNAFFGGIERATGVNVAHAYARHIVREIYG